MPLIPIIVKAIQSATRGLPLVRSIKELILPSKVQTPDGQKINVDNSSFTQKIIMLILEGASVYGIIWAAKYFGVTYQDIINLFGLISNK